MVEEPESEQPIENPTDEPAPFAATVTCSFPALPPPGPLGAQCWAGQAWPYGKTTPVLAAGGGMRNAWGDLTRPPGTYLATHTVEQLAEADRQRAACCMPPITPA